MSRHRRTGLTFGQTLLVGAGALAGGWLAYSRFVINHRQPLPPALNSPSERWRSPAAGFVHAYVDREAAGRPLVLVHSINAGASAYEMRPLFEHYRTQRPVWALDLPGFGMSERANRVYSPELYAGVIVELLDRLGEPADVIALSLGSEFAALAAHARPDRVHSLTLISPSGFTDRERKNRSQSANERGTSETARVVLSFPLWAQGFYDALVTPASLRWFLQQSFVGAVDPYLLDYAYLTTHQPNARYAPLYFVSGKLFTPDIRTRAYARIETPTLVVYDRDPYVRFDLLPEHLLRHDNWRAVRIAPSYGLPHWERLAQTTAALDSFWAERDTIRAAYDRL